MASVIGGTGLEKALGKIAANVAKASKVDVGFLAGATYPDGTSVPMVAAIQEFGAPRVGIPPRPFFRTMIAEKSGEWPKAIGALLQANDMDTAKTLDQVGAAIGGQLRESIVKMNEPALSPVTLLLRKWRSEGRKINGTVVAEARAAVAKGVTSGLGGTGAKPLIDTGHMSNSVDHAVT